MDNNIKFELLAEIIRTDQVTHMEAHKIFGDNPKFFEWYKEKYLPEQKKGQHNARP